MLLAGSKVSKSWVKSTAWQLTPFGNPPWKLGLADSICSARKHMLGVNSPAEVSHSVLTCVEAARKLPKRNILSSALNCRRMTHGTEAQTRKRPEPPRPLLPALGVFQER